MQERIVSHHIEVPAVLGPTLSTEATPAIQEKQIADVLAFHEIPLSLQRLSECTGIAVEHLPELLAREEMNTQMVVTTVEQESFYRLKSRKDMIPAERNRAKQTDLAAAEIAMNHPNGVTIADLQTLLAVPAFHAYDTLQTLHTTGWLTSEAQENEIRWHYTDLWEATIRPQFEKHARKISGYISRLLGESTKTEDILQEVYLNSYRARLTLDLQKNLEPWFLQVAHNRCISEIRKLEAKQTYVSHVIVDEEELSPFDILPDPAPFPEEQTERNVLQKALFDAIDSLPQRFRQAVLLRYYELSYPEIAARLNINEENARSYFRQARPLLRAALQEQGITATGLSFSKASDRQE